jgi:TonB-dependent receptor
MALAGATVLEARTRISAVTNAQGFFEIRALPAGEHRLVVRYIGFAPDSFTVMSADGQRVTKSVVLRPNATALAPVVVQDKVAGEAYAINAKRNADNIMEVATSDVIKSRPDPNIADAVGRLPGVSIERDEGEGKYIQVRGTEPRFSNVTINGAHVPSPEGTARVVKLDVIPSDLVSEIRLNKTLSADMEADAIGGSVDIISKTPAAGREYATFTASGGHINLMNNSVGQFAGTYGRRVGQDQKLGFLLDGSFDRNNRAINDIEPVWDVAAMGSQQVPVLSENDARDYQYYRTRVGFGTDVDYQLAPNSTVYFKGLFSEFHNYGTRYNADAVPGDGTITPSSSTTGTAVGGTMTRSVSTRRPDEQIWSATTGGNHALDRMTIDYSASLSHAQRRTLGARGTNFVLDSVDYAYDVSDPKFPQYTMGAAANDPSQFKFSSFSIDNSRATDQDLAGKLNIAVPYQLGDMPSTFKFGGALTDDATRLRSSSQNYNGYTGTFTLANALAAFSDPNFYFNRYDLGPLASDGGAAKFEDANLANFTVNTAKNTTAGQNNFNGSETIYAAYAMNTMDVGPARVNAGLRFEGTKTRYDGFTVRTPTTGAITVVPTTDKHAYTDLFPSLQMRYAVNEETNFRFAFTEGIARPNFSDLAPKQIVGDKKKTVSMGNTELDPTHALNYDLIVEHYIGSVGLLSAGAFYKSITDFIFTHKFVLASGSYAGYTATQPQNGEDGHVAGLELNWQQRFTFLPSIWRGVGVNLNYTVASSKATVPNADSTTRTTTLPRQGASNANAELTYDYSRLSVRGGLTWNAKNLWEYGDDASSDVYLSNHVQYDANLSFVATPNARIFLQMLNINNAVFGFYQGSTATPIQREFYGWTTYLGVKIGG